MSPTKPIEQAIQDIHRTFGEAEHQLSQLGDRLQFLIGTEGEIEIVRREKTGQTVRPKLVVAKLKGCDPILWRADHPSWLLAIDPERDSLGVDSERSSEPPREEEPQGRKGEATGDDL